MERKNNQIKLKYIKVGPDRLKMDVRIENLTFKKWVKVNNYYCYEVKKETKQGYVVTLQLEVEEFIIQTLVPGQPIKRNSVEICLDDSEKYHVNFALLSPNYKRLSGQDLQFEFRNSQYENLFKIKMTFTVDRKNFNKFTQEQGILIEETRFRNQHLFTNTKREIGIKKSTNSSKTCKNCVYINSNNLCSRNKVNVLDDDSCKNYVWVRTKVYLGGSVSPR